MTTDEIKVTEKGISVRDKVWIKLVPIYNEVTPRIKYKVYDFEDNLLGEVIYYYIMSIYMRCDFFPVDEPLFKYKFEVKGNWKTGVKESLILR